LGFPEPDANLPNCSNLTVNWTNATDGQAFTNLNPIAFGASTTVNTGSIAQVEFFVPNASVGVDNTSQYGLTWTPPAYGSYTLKAVATDNAGATATNQISISAQLPGTCGTVAGLNATAITSAGATLGWSAVSGANNYTVDYKTNTASTWTNAATATTSISVNLSGLTANTLYDWRVRANCATATGAYSTTQFTTALVVCCGTVTGAGFRIHHLLQCHCGLGGLIVRCKFIKE